MDDSEVLFRSLEELHPKIRARREAIESARRLPPDLVDDLRRAGVFALQLPRDLGGAQADALDVLRAIEILARADGSTGWCAMVACANNGAAGFSPAAGMREVFADPTIPTSGVFAPTGAAVRVDRGVRVSGRWQFASGITHAAWVWGGCLVLKDGQPNMTPTGPEIVYAWMPIGSVEVHDTWFVTGLCGTGSNDVTAAEVFVPDARTFSFADTSGHRTEPLYRLPALGWFVSQVAAVSLGVGRAALDELTAAAQTKVPTFSMAVLADRPAAQIELARAEAALGAARAGLHDTVAELWRTLGAGGQPSPRQVALNRVAASHAAETAAAVTRTASLLAGGSAIAATSALQRHMRDADAIAHHFTVAPHVWEDAGRVFLGRQPQAPMF